MYKNVCYFMGTDADRGGAGRILFSLIKKLDYKKYKPIVILTAYGAASEEFDELGITYFIRENHKKRSLYKYFLDILRSVVFYKSEKVDLIHLNNGCIGWKPPELFAARLLNIPVVTHIQQVIKNSSPYIRYSRAVVACSRFTAETSNTLSVPTYVAYDLVNVDRFKCERDMTRVSGLGNDNIVIAFIGRARKSKGLETFVRLHHDIADRNVRFLISARKSNITSDSYSMDEITEFMSQDERFIYSGSRPDVESIYASSDIVVMPSQGDEPCPAVAIEAGACCKPIVAMKSGSISEFIIHGENGFLVDKHDYDSLVKYTLMLVNDEAMRHRMGVRSREIVEERFKDKPARDIEALYEKLVQ